MRGENLQPTQDAIEKLKRVQEFSTQPFDSRVATFAKFLATRLNGGDIVPLGFMMAASLALYDVEKGESGFTGEPLTTGLEHQDPYVYTLISLNVPALAQASFPKPFADEVMLEYGKYLDLSGKEADELVIRPVSTIEQAQTLIFDSALNKVKLLDWENLGINGKEKDIEKLFNAVFPLILRNSGMNFPLNILMDDEPQEADLLKEADPERKKHLGGKFWLTIINRVIPVEEATFIRDWLYCKSPEFISHQLGLDKNEAIKHFLNNNPSYLMAGIRLNSFLEKNNL